MQTIIIRNVPDEVLSKLDARANARNESRQNYLLGVLTELADDDPGVVYGYFKMDRPADIDPGSIDCPECGQDMNEFWFYTIETKHGPVIGGPVCDICATSE